jgi:hypothetical protein
VNPPLNNPAPGPGPLRTGTTAKVLDGRRNQIFILAAFVIVLVLLVRACSGRENTYERIAHELTQAIQNNDYAAVAKLENAETAADMGRARLGHASDQLAPLGKIKRVHEVPTTSKTPRVHEFDVSFDKGAAHEIIQFDPANKVFHFHEQVTPSQ